MGIWYKAGFRIEILELKIEDLPKRSDLKHPALEAQFIGNDFVIDHNAAMLKVPSNIIPLEANYLINLLLPDASKITIIACVPMVFDKRVKK